jgi:hypothetical protein
VVYKMVINNRLYLHNSVFRSSCSLYWNTIYVGMDCLFKGNQI